MDELAQDLDRERKQAIQMARAMDPQEKLWRGLQLFEEECEARYRLLREDMPTLTDADVKAVLRQQLDEERERERASWVQVMFIPR